MTDVEEIDSEDLLAIYVGDIRHDQTCSMAGQVDIKIRKRISAFVDEVDERMNPSDPELLADLESKLRQDEENHWEGIDQNLNDEIEETKQEILSRMMNE